MAVDPGRGGAATWLMTAAVIAGFAVVVTLMVDIGNSTDEIAGQIDTIIGISGGGGDAVITLGPSGSGNSATSQWISDGDILDSANSVNKLHREFFGEIDTFSLAYIHTENGTTTTPNRPLDELVVLISQESGPTKVRAKRVNERGIELMEWSYWDDDSGAWVEYDWCSWTCTEDPIPAGFLGGLLDNDWTPTFSDGYSWSSATDKPVLMLFKTN